MAKLKKQYFIGMDVGGTKLLTTLLDGRFRVLASTKLRVEVSKGRQNFLSVLMKSIQEVAEESGVPLRKVAAVGIGCPGIIDPKHGKVLISPNLPFLKNYPLREKLSRKLHLHVALENDVNAGLYGEHRLGAAQGYRNVVGVFLGTGVGGGLILKDKLFVGAFGSAGEIGHMILDPLGPRCGCGQRGCLEAFVGRTAIASEAAMLAARQQAPALFKLVGTEVSKIKSGVLAKSIAAGDKNIERLLREKARLLGMALANVANLLNPELIVLGGGLVEALGNIFLKEAADSLKKYAMPPIAKQVKIVCSELMDWGVAKGAAKMALDEMKG